MLLKSVGLQAARTGFRLDLGRHHAFGARPVSNHHILAWPQFGHAVAPQRFHVNEDIRGALAARNESEATKTVEPLDLRTLQPARRSHAHMGPWREHLRRMNCRRLIHRKDAEGLIALLPTGAFANQP